MGLLSIGTVALVAVLALAAPITAMAVWNRLGTNVVVRVGVRTVLLVAGQALAVLLAALLLNRSYDFYTSWSELFGKAGVAAVTSGAGPRSVDARYGSRLRAAFRANHGTVVPWAIPGTASGLPSLPALLYLPAAYGNPAAADVKYPVVELLDGFPASPSSWTGALKLQSTLDSQIRSMHSLPFVAVMPTTNVKIPRDTECVNVVHGPRVDTYLTRDVRTAVAAAVRVQTGATGWGLMGYSTGGYCAMNLAMRHPNLFSAAVSMSGYDHPYQDASTGPGRLFYGSRALRDRNSPRWEAQHWHGRGLRILTIASRDDAVSFRQAIRLAAAARPPLRITELLLARGGHNAGFWVRLEPVAFNWLSSRLQAPLAGITITGGVLRTPTPSGGNRSARLSRDRSVAVHRRPGVGRRSHRSTRPSAATDRRLTAARKLGARAALPPGLAG